MAAFALLVFMMPSLAGWGQTRDSYSHEYDYSALKELLPANGDWSDAGTYIKIPSASGGSESFTIPIDADKQPTGAISLTFEIATFGSGNAQTASTTTIAAVGTEANSTWSGSGVSSYPSSATYVNGVMTIAVPNDPTTLEGLNITMGVSTGVRIFRLRTLTVAYTYNNDGTTYTVTFNAGDGTFVGSNDFPSTTNTKAEGTYTLPSATRDGYTFDGWLLTGNTEPLTGSYYVSADVDFTAQYTESTTPPGPVGGQTLTFDFEDETAHRTSGSNSYTSTNTYSENDATILLTYADAVGSGSPLSGSYHVIGRVAKSTTNSPVVLIGPINITDWTITKIEYLTKGVAAMSQVFETSMDGSQWTTQHTLTSMPTSVTTETVGNLSITGTQLYLRWTVSVASSTGSNRDFNLDDIVITYAEASNPNPSIVADDVDIAYDATSGAIGYTINNPVEGGTLTASTNDSWLNLGTVDTTVPFTCAANEGINARTATVTLTYTYGENDETVTKEVTVTQAGNPNVASITINPATVNVTANEADGTLTVTYNNITEVLAEVHLCDANGDAATYDWIMADIDQNNNVYYVIDANEGEARTAYLKVYALGDNAEDVYSALVTINQAAYVAPLGNTYMLYSGALVEGDYVIYYDGSAMKNTINSGRLTYEEVEPDGDVVVTEDASIIWHIAPSGNYWTIYSVDANAYAAGTGVKNKAQLLADGTDDKALWTVNGTETYDFINKANAAAGVNAYLRNNKDANTNYGFACYASGTGGALTLYKNTSDITYVATPTFSPAPASYPEDLYVTISCSTEGTIIYYTTDGSDPTVESDMFADSILVSEGVTTIKAIAVLDTIVSGIATGIYNINPNPSGTFENPYLVQEAKENTPSTGNVYVRGIVSEIASTASEVVQYHDISYYISADGSTANQLYVRYGMNVDSTEFYSRSELQLGDRVVVCGKLEKGTTTHSSSSNNPRLAEYNYLVSLERDVEPPYFSPESCMMVNDENALVYIFSETYEAEIRYTMDGTDPNTNSTLFNEEEPINLQGVTGTVTIKAIAYYEGMHSAISTVTYRMVEPGTPGTMETPYTVAEILHIMDSVSTIDQVYVRGVVCTNPIIEQSIYHNANYYIADSLTAEEDNQLYVYRGKGLGGEPIESEDDLRKGDIVTVLGDLWIYHNVKEFKPYSIIYERQRPASINVSSQTTDCGEKNGRLNVSYYNIYFQVNPPTVQLCDAYGNAAEYDWLTVTLNGDYVNYHLNAAGDVVLPRTAYLKVIGHDWSGNEVVSNLASITQTECVFAPLPFRYAYERESGETDDQLLARLDSIPDGLEVFGLGDYNSNYPYLVFNAPNDTTGQQDYIKLAFDEEPSRLTFDIQGDGFRGGYFFLETSTDGLEGNWNIIAVYTTTELIAQMGDDNPLKPVAKVIPAGRYETMTFDNLPSDVRYIRWIYETRSVGNVRLGDIHLYTPADLYDIVLIQPELDGCSISADKVIAVENETVTLSYELADDYTFVDWIVKDENDNAIEVVNNQFQMPASDVTVSAELGVIQRYDIVLIQPEFDNCSIAADKVRAAEGDTITLSYELAEGYYFIEWKVTDENEGTVAVSDNQFIMPASNVTVEAVMVETTTEYQYVYSINGVETEPQTATVGATITLDNGSNINAFEFIGWTTDPNDVVNVMPAESSYTIMEDMTFYAVYYYSDTTAVNQYVKVTENLNDWSGDYLIVYEDGNLAFNGGLETLDAIGNSIDVTIANDVIASNATTDAAKFTIEAVTDGYSIKSASGKYMGRESNANGMDEDTIQMYRNTISFNGESVDVIGNGGAYLRYNATANQTRFRYFKSSTYTAQKAIQLYKYSGRADERYTRVFVDNPEGAVAIAGPSIIPSGYVLNVSSITNELGADKLLIEEGAQLVTSSNVNATMRKTINGFQGEANDSYCFISSPVNDLDPADLGMVGGNYDLYYFDQDSTDAEWQNYKAEQFNLTTGMGYLYAKASGGTITVAGMMNGSTGNITLDGWYLIGNPYPCNVTINVPFYRLDENGAALVLTDSSVAIAPMEGVLVHVEGVTVVFTKAPQVPTIGNNGSKVVFMINKQ